MTSFKIDLLLSCSYALCTFVTNPPPPICVTSLLNGLQLRCWACILLGRFGTGMNRISGLLLIPTFLFDCLWSRIPGEAVPENIVKNKIPTTTKLVGGAVDAVVVPETGTYFSGDMNTGHVNKPTIQIPDIWPSNMLTIWILIFRSPQHGNLCAGATSWFLRNDWDKHSFTRIYFIWLSFIIFK